MTVVVPAAEPCACGRQVIRTCSAATGVPLVLGADLIPVMPVLDKRGRPTGEDTAALVGYRLGPAGATVACGPGPAGFAGAGESYDVHVCRPVRRGGAR